MHLAHLASVAHQARSAKDAPYIPFSIAFDHQEECLPFEMLKMVFLINSCYSDVGSL